MSNNPRTNYPPTVRGDCYRGGPNDGRPCPFDQCRYHIGFAGDETCCLDVADERGVSIKRVAEALGDTEDAIEAVTRSALAKLEIKYPWLREYLRD